ncbi:acyl-CoA dehydrogenase family protein [Phenylobacterium sp.]|jgi:alkylation response protein AidB-like acyl-CoA dehydrogenase|uniref:acyl-CoA dehydrogenase family protein n=1 Tax=Phenylobacterium sp. TaxID=1871053 RepID=UPI002F3E9A97
MDFAFSEEQLMAAESVRAALADLCTGADLRRLMASGEARDARRWQALAGLGLSGLMVAEDLGGLGLSEPDLVLMAEACGHAALPEPLVENAGVGAPLLAAFAGDARAAPWLERVVNGEATVAVSHPANPFVADADAAGVLLIAREDGLHLVEPGAARLTRHESIDPFRRLFTAAFDASAATRLATPAEAAPHLALAFDRAALFAAAQGLGLAQRTVEMAADYAKERHQFGKPIGANQAIKHHLATCQTAIVFARPVVHAAAAQISQQDIFSRARVSHAKLAALSAASLAARTAIQVHGAMGYSWEVDVHFYLKRALALTGAWGDEAFHRARVAERAYGAPLGPRHTFPRAAPAMNRI